MHILERNSIWITHILSVPPCCILQTHGFIISLILFPWLLVCSHGPLSMQLQIKIICCWNKPRSDHSTACLKQVWGLQDNKQSKAWSKWGIVRTEHAGLKKKAYLPKVLTNTLKHILIYLLIYSLLFSALLSHWRQRALSSVSSSPHWYAPPPFSSFKFFLNPSVQHWRRKFHTFWSIWQNLGREINQPVSNVLLVCFQHLVSNGKGWKTWTVPSVFNEATLERKRRVTLHSSIFHRGCKV